VTEFYWKIRPWP